MERLLWIVVIVFGVAVCQTERGALVVGFLLSLLGYYIVLGNWHILWQCYKTKKHISYVPVVGSVCILLGWCALRQVVSLPVWFLLPMLLDWGGFRMVALAILWNCWVEIKKRLGRGKCAE